MMKLLQNLFGTSRPRSRLRAVGSFLPERVVDNDELAGMIECPDEALRRSLPRYVEALTGIRTRRFAERTESPSILAARAAAKALAQARLKPGEIDTLIFAATDLDQIEPATANNVMEHLGMAPVTAFDVKSACNSVLQAMVVMDAMIASGCCRRGLIVSGEAGSHWACRSLRDRAELATKLAGLTLGDGGAAMILEASDDGRGLLESNLVTVPGTWRLCRVPHETGWRETADDAGIMGWFYLNLEALTEVVQTHVPAYCREYARHRSEQHGESCFSDHLDYLIPHQISVRLIRLMCSKTGMPPERTALTADRYGNTAATSIPIALDEAIQGGRLVPGSRQEVILFGAASGFSIGHVRLRL